MTRLHNSDSFCMAPWTHTYLSPQTERRICCASREPATAFTQYIDSGNGTGQYTPTTLDEHWNSEHMKSVRRRMMAGETLPECEVCNTKILNTDVYRSYFNSLFGHKYVSAIESTDATGATTMKPVSWDYRFSNLCNFKCRMCGDMLSSSWESELKQHNRVDWNNPRNNWMKPGVRERIEDFQSSEVEEEFAKAVEEHRIEEVYWVGGEPLMYEQHWKYMRRILELGDGPRVYARYNTNLSRISYRGINLFSDILAGLRDWQVCASLDGTGEVGEYIRTGLKFDTWLENFRSGVQIQRNRRQMRIDFTLTLPGMFEVTNIEKLGRELGVDILAKVVFSFGPDILMSPLALPRHLLEPWLDELIPQTSGAMRDILVNLKNRPTFDEQWPDSYQQAAKSGKERLLFLEKIRPCSTNMEKILSSRPEILKWWNSI